MKSDERILELPQPIIDRLREVISRIRRLQWIKGSLLTLAAALAAVLSVMALDAAISLENVIARLALSGLALVFTAWVAWTQWFRPLAKRISLTAVARWVETRHPELQERISTAVELLGDRHADDQGSRELLEAVVQDAVADVGRLDPAQDLSSKRTLPAKWLAGSTAAVLLLMLALWPQQVPRLLARALAPMADVGNAWAGKLRVLTVSRTVAIGDPLGIEVAVRDAGKTRVELHMIQPDGSTVIEMLTPDAAVPVESGESGYALRIPGVQQGFTARVVSGKATSAAFTIKAVPRPETGPWTLAYDYPDYTGLADEVKANASGEILALAGTKVTISTPLNRPVSKAFVRIGESTMVDGRVLSGTAGSSVEWSTVLTPRQDSLWALELEDAEGITNRPVSLPIRSVVDLPPVITLETPVEDRLELRPIEKLALTYSVKEDIGLSAVQIRIRPQDKPEYLMAPESLPEKSQGTVDEYRGTAVLDLAKVPVPDGQEIKVSLMAADRLPAEMQGPQRAYSREIVIRLNRWTQPLMEKNFQAQYQELRRDMDEVKRDLQEARGRMNDKPDRLRHDEQLSENVLKDLERSTSAMQEAQEKMKELTERMKKSAFARQTPDLQQIAQEMVKPAEAQAREIPLTDQKEARSEMAQASKDLLEKAIQKIEEEQKQMDQDRQAVQQIAKLSDIAEQQQRLAAEAAEAANPAAATDPAAQQPSPQGQDANAMPPPASAQAEGQSPPEANGKQEPGQKPPGDQSQTAKAPTEEEQRKWLEEQRKVAQRAKELMEQNQNSNPQALQEQLKQAAGQAAEMAAKAEALSKKEQELASQIPQAATPEAKQQTASAQEQLAREVGALQEQAKGFQQTAAPQIDQSTETQETAWKATSSLTEADAQARQAGQELAAAATPPTSAAPDSAATPKPEPTGGESPAPSPGQTAQTSPGENPAEGNNKEGSPQANSTTAQSKEAQAIEPHSPASPAQPAGPAGQQAAQDSAQSLAEAAESYKALGQELNSLAGMVAEHNQSLAEGAQQAGTAVDQAAKAQEGQGKGPSMQQGAQAAQQAADRLTLAASTAMQAMSIPGEAKSNNASSPSKGKGKSQDGQPKPGTQPGQEGQEGMQLDTASGALPAELAKLGLTLDDWMKLRSSLNGVEGASSEQIPAEYRDLVKAYFGALATGGNPSPKK